MTKEKEELKQLEDGWEKIAEISEDILHFKLADVHYDAHLTLELLFELYIRLVMTNHMNLHKDQQTVRASALIQMLSNAQIKSVFVNSSLDDRKILKKAYRVHFPWRNNFDIGQNLYYYLGNVIVGALIMKAEELWDGTNFIVAIKDPMQKALENIPKLFEELFKDKEKKNG